ncbi:MAG: hypothetical protein JRF63_14310, partial [Deltaproteobacteria bacterium]|nr:hypothetical protein [Deltaproteobacteria bacterium]
MRETSCARRAGSMARRAHGPRGSAAVLAIAVTAIAAGASAARRTHATRVAEALDARLGSVSKTEQLLDDKYRVRVGETRTRVRSLYKLSRAG